MKKVVKITKSQLEKLYIKDKLNTYQIAKRLRCCQGTIWNRLFEFKIKRRTPHDFNSNVPSKERLIELYIKKKLSTWKIEKLYGYSRGTIHRKLNEYGLKTRSLAESNIKYPRKDFSGDLIEKSYLIGFAMGDLGVRKIFPKSETVYVASGSTIPEQIDLIKELFEGYGKIWIQRTNGKINIQTNLNRSFDFLLDKKFPQWVEGDIDLFLAFLAGFIDAEGTIGISNKMAYLSIGNYDSETLSCIHNNLKKLGINSHPPHSDSRKGKKNNQGYVYRENYWTFRIDKKSDLLHLLLELKPHIRHPLKIKALNMAIENIIMRNNEYGKK